jgi:hypothetical protein
MKEGDKKTNIIIGNLKKLNTGLRMCNAMEGITV